MAGKPTPTQEENDRAALGDHVLSKEDDGSGPDPNVVSQKQSEPKSGSGGTYQTRAARAATQPPRSE